MWKITFRQVSSFINFDFVHVLEVYTFSLWIVDCFRGLHIQFMDSEWTVLEVYTFSLWIVDCFRGLYIQFMDSGLI